MLYISGGAPEALRLFILPETGRLKHFLCHLYFMAV
ncbi:MAG: hypothetical protein JWM59_749 [Verrucomicrobiales bacterium]|nr:hypothetical protein [Verrucomicrobiales bacterium]